MQLAMDKEILLRFWCGMEPTSTKMMSELFQLEKQMIEGEQEERKRAERWRERDRQGAVCVCVYVRETEGEGYRNKTGSKREKESVRECICISVYLMCRTHIFLVHIQINSFFTE
jgi:hypothetical protein